MKHIIRDGIYFVALVDKELAPGETEVPARPSASHQWQNGEWVEVPPDPAEVLAEWRATAQLTRLQMAVSLRTAQILDQGQAETFARGDIPIPIAALIDTLPEEIRPDARLAMAGAREFDRADPMWDLLTASEGWPGDADVDAIFGWSE